MFAHERLKVYQIALAASARLEPLWAKRALDFMRWFNRCPGARELSSRLHRQVDKAGTSLVLNMAEGNGRFAELDHRQFLEIAEASAWKAATYLDLWETQEGTERPQIQAGKDLLEGVARRLAGWLQKWQT